ncbi:MFS transporter permease [Kiloniella spongiae]|uniref:MFS transporter permease n=1 Tax=Kiloniella spongiae TaxID=1489064 RepID=A0A0H2MC63_9PROT|nr:organoarsenical effux MFS transporter ArsJ [Kiloniella spongiae]KLN59913.1 MFS transporter permease [Kiloniella spongiae]
MSDLRSYGAVTAAYWGFTLTDGALRMLVLLHFHRLGFTPLDLAYLFLLYEAMGIVTNFVGGWIAARFGLRLTLFLGLTTQIVALGLLSQLRADWSIDFSIIYVMGAQALSGVAKDLTKMSSKSAVKLVAKDDGEDKGTLFRWVAILTGSKNALKGLGFLLGGVLLEWVGFENSLLSMALSLVVVLGTTALVVKVDLGKAKQKIRTKELFSKSRAINVLSFARIFLFAARDVWFVVGLPVFLYSTLGWSFDEVGAFMALWVIGYGTVQALVPKLTKKVKGPHSGIRVARFWGGVLAVLPAVIAVVLWQDLSFSGAFLLFGILVFGFVFAINSSLHSYLIVACSDADKVALNVGFYYMANAIGRLMGTLLSGLIFQYAGLEACLLASTVMLVIATFTIFFLEPGQSSVSSSA